MLFRLLGILCLLATSLTKAAVPPERCWLKNPERPALDWDINEKLADIDTLRSLNDLPSILDSLRDRWTLAFASHSTQTEDVRVVAFSQDARTIVAYTGCPEDSTVPYARCERLETITFRDSKFEFREVRFPGAHFPDLKPKVSEPNPTLCLSCHGVPPVPIWEAYNTWPSFFGVISRLGEDVVFQDSAEGRKYEAFTKRVWAEPTKYARYTKLSWDRDRKLRQGRFSQGSADIYTKAGITLLPVQHSQLPDPNSQLNKALKPLNAERIIRQIVMSPDFEKVRPALLARLLRCEGAFESFLSPDLREEVGLEEWSKQVTQTQRTNFDAVAAKILLLTSTGKPLPADGLYTPVVPELFETVFTYLWEPLHIGRGRFNTAVDQPYNFTDGQNFAFPQLNQIFENWVGECEPDFALAHSEEDRKLKCLELKKKADAS